MATAQEVCRFIAEWCSDHGNMQSGWTVINPMHFVYTEPLFDALAEAGFATQEEIARWFNARQGDKEMRDAR